MYKVLIVEDEKILRDGICDELNSMGLFETSSATNGCEALEKLRAHAFDGIILDIRMPKMDGIELLSHMSSEGISPIKIVLSGYDEFEYAQKSIEYGVIEYILKPFTPRALRNTGEKLCETIEQQRAADCEITLLRERVEASKPILREKLLNDLIEGVDTNRFSKQAKYIGIEFPYRCFQVAVFKSGNENYSNGMYEETLQIAFLAITRRITSELGKHMVCEPLGDNMESLTVIFNFEESADVFNICEDALLASPVCKVGLAGLSVMGGISGIYDGLGQVREAYGDAVEALRYNTMLARVPLLMITDIAASGGGLRLPDESQILNMCRLGMARELNEYIREYFDCIRERSPGLTDVYMAAEYIAILCCTAASAVAGTDISSLIEDVRSVRTLESIYIVLTQIIDNACTEILKYRKGQSISGVEQAKRFIKQNYASQLSVVDVAEHVQLSSNYLGKLFKEYEGMNISDYINKVRIARACELIKTTNEKNYQIAYAVGYNDPNYFSVVFKKVTGINPKEYREKSLRINTGSFERPFLFLPDKTPDSG
ncbi:MAG: response regulator [Eubacteriales bacterium]|nr:response regulator [Eubacteriales bacterium]